MSENKKLAHLIVHLVYILLYLILIISAVAFYDYKKLSGLIWTGWILFFIGIIILFLSLKARKEVVVEGALVRRGIYAFVRHPGYLAHMIIILSLILLTQYWIGIIVGLVLIVFLIFAVIEEDKRNVSKFGNDYVEYMRSVPRVNIFMSIFKKLIKRK